MPVYIGLEEIDFPIPDWIRDHCNEEGHYGGWFFPIYMTPTHPLILEKATCSWCGDPILVGDDAIVMPYSHEEGGGEWRKQHYECTMRCMLPKDHRPKVRPSDYASLTPKQRWLIDKRLDILDYDPDAKPAFGEALAKAFAAKKEK